MSDAIKRVEKWLDSENDYTYPTEEVRAIIEEIKQERRAIIQFCWHSYADLDGNMDWPNNKEGDLIRAMYLSATKDQTNEHKT